MASKLSLAAGFLASAIASPQCCWSAWGDDSSCGGYPSGGSSGLCNTAWGTSCSAAGDCPTTPTPPPTPPTPAVPTPPPSPPTPPVPTPPPTPPAPPSADLLAKVLAQLKASDSDGVFLYETASSGWLPSDLYKWEDMIDAVSVMATDGIGDAKLWIGEGEKQNYGLVNIAAFLAQCMQETIRYNACDENNWSDPKTAQTYGGETYASVSACGQAHQSYEDYKCTAEEDATAGGKMACDVDPNMQMRAHTGASWYGAPPPMFCAPKSVIPKAPKWNYGSPWCPARGGYDYQEPFPADVDLATYFDYVNSGGGCRDYDPVKAGGWEFCGGAGCAGSPPLPVFGKSARTDLEGCCWWGRGVIQSTGVCNFGKLNFYMGARAHKEGRNALYPDVDFCQNPGYICDPAGPPELKWISGFFYWLNSVQTYQADDGWVYLEKLKSWVDSGMSTADTSFIDGASGIVNRGCYNPPACGTGELDGAKFRSDNFKTVLGAMKLSASFDDEIEV